ncbi:unnamed protein product [Meloidogyne enterolobii]|uniref:Uncharacterized protein n=1 Tax=Meloidogyne enterolobii TaxID=390850 RepID=A0ACB1ATX0_MELEN
MERFMKDNKSTPEKKDLTCTTAIYEKGVNLYELDFANTTGTPSCILLNNYGTARKGGKLSQAEQPVDSQNNKENKIDQLFDHNKGGIKFI